MTEVSLQIDSVHNPRVTWEGCSVLLDINDGDRLVFARLSAASTLKIGDKNCSLRPLIGCPFGSLFQVESGSKGPFLTRVLATPEDNLVQEIGDCQLKDEHKDNRALVDNNTAQSLTGEDIDAMRRQGTSGGQIVEALIANSSTFGKKTLFSQEKYRLKKQKKYAPRVLLRRPFARSICEAYFKKYPARIGFLRVDTLSLLLSMANVSASSDVLVVDMVGGILTGAVAERLGGTGYVCNTHFGVTPYPIDIVRIFNFNNEVCSRIVRSPIIDLCSAQNRNPGYTWKHEDVCTLKTQSNIGEVALSSLCVSSSGPLSISEDQIVQEETFPHYSCSHSISTEEICTSSGNGMQDLVPIPMHAIGAPTVIKACKSTKHGEKASEEAVHMWKENGFSSLIIAAPELDAWSAIQELLPLLSYSAPFAIYHQFLQPLATCMHNLQIAKMAIGLQISEPWLREYQVLPSRTHPCMQMSAFGGYILSGIKICSSEAQLQTK
ncbi:hypothetical protein HHK36_031221 [Tetracentron sinense]|uniref:tRNA (adenine(58)-N(1))-methyltransferase non-catalytic subunit TRM6 n=1 Tax=Tetracentron sinense TaxID=13715 RepID=A0A834YDK0_TETSI|nr:hypothetical protein HHK36_031221 [Tetracentron sinense]